MCANDERARIFLSKEPGCSAADSGVLNVRSLHKVFACATRGISILLLQVPMFCHAEQTMINVKSRLTALFVERLSKRWVVRDPEGNFWIIPSVENAWDQRQPFFLTEKAELEPVPVHYLHMLHLPF